MDYDRLLNELIGRIDFAKHDAFSTSKYCSYFKYKDEDLALIWQPFDTEELQDRECERIHELKEKVDDAKKDGAKIPAILSYTKAGKYVFQLQERVHGKKIEYLEILADKTEVSEMIELLLTLDIMNRHGVAIDQGYNCLVDEDGSINLFDTYVAKVNPKPVNSKPWFFSQFVIREPKDLTTEGIEVLRKIIKKWIKACVTYFKDVELPNIRDEVYSTVKDLSFISTEEKYQLIDEELALQKEK